MLEIISGIIQILVLLTTCTILIMMGMTLVIIKDKEQPPDKKAKAYAIGIVHGMFYGSMFAIVMSIITNGNEKSVSQIRGQIGLLFMLSCLMVGLGWALWVLKHPKIIQEQGMFYLSPPNSHTDDSPPSPAPPTE